MTALRPSSGVRFVLERVDAPGDITGARCSYGGHAHLPDRDVPLTLEVDGAAVKPHERATDAPADPLVAELARDAAALVRAAVKAAAAAGRRPPRRIVRWRG